MASRMPGAVMWTMDLIPMMQNLFCMKRSVEGKESERSM